MKKRLLLLPAALACFLLLSGCKVSGNPLPEGMEEQGESSVLRQQIDTNHHVNNGQYVQMAEEFLPEGFQIRQMRAEYKKAAMLHDVIVPMACHQDGVCTVALCDEEKRPYASVEFTSFV